MKCKSSDGPVLVSGFIRGGSVGNRERPLGHSEGYHSQQHLMYVVVDGLIAIIDLTTIVQHTEIMR